MVEELGFVTQSGGELLQLRLALSQPAPHWRLSGVTPEYVPFLGRVEGVATGGTPC